MANGFQTISKMNFEKLKSDSLRLSIIFDYLKDIHLRVRTLEKRKRFDPILIGVCAFLGGAAALVGKTLIF